jgi:hypothetical protein
MFSTVKRSLIDLLQVFMAFRTVFAWATIIIHLALASIASLVLLVHHGLSIVHEWLVVEDKDKDDGKAACKQVYSDSPANMDTAIADPASDSWVDLTDINGIPCGYLLDASFRWKYNHFDNQHVQGSLQLQRFGSMNLYRVIFEGFKSLSIEGTIRKGPEVAGVLYLPCDGSAVLVLLKGRSEKSRMKVLGLKAEFQGTTDQLEHIQVIIQLGYKAEKLSEGLRFQSSFETAIGGGFPIAEATTNCRL